MYIQPWDDHDVNASVSGIVGRKGIKYDAASPETTYGPFREGETISFFMTEEQELFLSNIFVIARRSIEIIFYTGQESIGFQNLVTKSMSLL